MLDLHTHILPGIDDGPPDMQTALAMARISAWSGTTRLVATPHVDDRYRPSPADVVAAVLALRTELKRNRIDLALATGAEVALTHARVLDDATLAGYTLAGAGTLLVECPLSPIVRWGDELVVALRDRGFRILLAHPERCPAFQREPRRLEGLVAEGCLCSITAGALHGQFGRSAQKLAQRLVRDGLAHDVASDAHDAGGRAPDLAGTFDGSARELRIDPETADWLTRLAPAAILAGEPLPDRP
jgi:protein-tyrosine phosphatase